LEHLPETTKVRSLLIDQSPWRKYPFRIAATAAVLLAMLSSCLFTTLTQAQAAEQQVSQPGAQYSPEPPRANALHYRMSWALVVGIDDYSTSTNRLEPLLFAVNDAKAFNDIVVAEFGYVSERVRLLTDKRATSTAVRTWLRELKPENDDSVLVFFSGHGLIDEATGEGYLAAVDSRAGDLPGSCISVNWLRAELAKLPCRHKLMILDSCYSGSLFRESPRTRSFRDPAIAAAGSTAKSGTTVDGARGLRRTTADAESEVGNLAYYMQHPTFQGISAARFTPAADGLGENRHSIFTSALLQVMRERADSIREDHIFTFRQLASIVEARVANSLRSRQIPDWGSLGPGDGDFVFRPLIRGTTPREESETRLKRAQLGRYNIQLRRIQEVQRYDPGMALKLLFDNENCPEPIRDFTWGLLHHGSKRDRMTLAKHEEGVLTVAFSADGKLLASAGHGHSIIVSDSRSGQIRTTLKGHNGSTYCLAFSPDSATLASVGGDKVLRLWSIEKGSEIAALEGHTGPVLAVAFSPDGKVIATGGRPSSNAGGEVKLWDVQARRARSTLASLEVPVYSLAISPDGRTLVTAGGSQTSSIPGIKFWDVATGKQQGAALGAPHTVYSSVAFSPNGETLAAAASPDRGVMLWDVVSRQPQKTLDGHDHWVVSSVAFSPDGNLLASAGEDKTIRLWNAATGEMRTTLRQSSWAKCVAFSPGGRTLASAGHDDHAVRLWDIDFDRESTDLVIKTGNISPLELAADVRFSPDGKLLALGVSLANHAGEIKVYESAANKEVATLRLGGNSIYGRAASVSFSPDGKSLAVAIRGSIRIWNTLDWKPIGGKIRLFECVAYSPDNKTFATGGRTLFGSHDQEEWMITNQGIHESPDGPGELQLVDVTTGRVRANLIGHANLVKSVAFSPDGRLLASASRDNTVIIWDMSSGRKQKTLRPRTDHMPSALIPFTGIATVAFAPDGRSVAAGDYGGTTTIWDVETGRERAALEGHVGSVLALAFSPDGRTLASGGGVFSKQNRPGELKLWDPETGQERCALEGHKDRVLALAFSPDGTSLVSFGADAVLKKWTADVGKDTAPTSYARGSPIDEKEHAELIALRGMNYSRIGSFNEAQTALLEAVQILLRLVDTKPRDSRISVSLGGAYCNLASVYRDSGDANSALVWYEKAITSLENDLATGSLEKLRQEPTARDYLSNGYFGRAAVFHNRGQYAEAAGAYRKSIEMLERLIADKQSTDSTHEVLAYRLHMLRHCCRGDQLNEEKAILEHEIKIRERLMHTIRTSTTNAADLGHAYCDMGAVHLNGGELRSALQWYDKGIAALEKVQVARPNDAKVRRFLRSGYLERSRVDCMVLEYERARSDRDRSLGLSAASELAFVHLAFALSLARSGKHGDAIKELDSAAGANGRTSSEYYNMCCVYAQAAAAVSRDSTLTDAKRKSLVDDYAAKAMDFLRKADAGGFFRDTNHISRFGEDADLKPLRAREDFRRLVESVGRKPD
jgi:WD40 repeat protein/tetratricopeptide (TPR) repeat protein